MGIEEFEKRLDFDSDTFEDMKHDMNFVLQRLLQTMQEKDATEGSMTLKIDISMIKEAIPNYDPNNDAETRMVSKPQFKHKVSSNVKINDEKSGNLNSEMELVLDEETGIYVLRPIANTAQRSIFDADFTEVPNDEAEDENVVEGTAIEGGEQLALPLNEEVEDLSSELIDGDDNMEYEDPEE